MTFLALTPLQAAVLALLTTGAVVVLYLLKLRHRRVLVSSSLLWHRVLDEQQARSLWEKLRKLVSILIAVAIALLIAMSLGRPQIESLTGPNERVIIVLDSSPSMATRTRDGGTRWQRAVQEAYALIDSAGAAAEFQIVDTSGRTVFPATMDRSEVRSMIRTLTPRNSVPRFPNLDVQDAQIYFISDEVGRMEVPPSARRISVFEPAENVGINAFEIRSAPARPLTYEAYLEVQNYGSQPAGVAIAISGPGSQRITRSVELVPGELMKEVFDLSSFDGGAIRAVVQLNGDSFPADDAAYAYLPVKRRNRTLLVTRGNSHLETLLRLDSYVDLLVTTPEGYEQAPNIDVYVFDRYAPPQPPPGPSLIVGVPDAPWLRSAQGTVRTPAITSWAEEHPLMQHVSVHDITVDQATRIDAADLVVIAASDQIPLIVASEEPKWVMLTFDLASSDFPFHVEFPVFIENVLAWFGRDQLALQRTPGIVEVPLRDAQIQTIDGRTVPSLSQGEYTTFEAEEPGLYTATAGDSRFRVAVSLTNRTFSDVNGSSRQGETPPMFRRHLLQRELWFYMLIAAIVLISVEWFTYHRRITV